MELGKIHILKLIWWSFRVRDPKLAGANLPSVCPLSTLVRDKLRRREETPHNIKLPKKLSVKVFRPPFPKKVASIQRGAALVALRRGRNPLTKSYFMQKKIGDPLFC